MSRYCLATAPLALAALTALGSAPQGQTAPYDVLTNSKADFANLNPEPVSGLDVDSDGNIWAVNPYGNAIVSHDGGDAVPELVAPTAHAPVSLAVLERSGEPRRIVVVCQGSNGVALHDAGDGRLLDFERVDDEPADIVIDAAGAFAYVSCLGDNTVVKLDLSSFTVVDRYAIDGGQRPGPLHLDEAAGRLYVACTVTGNHTVPFKSPNLDVGIVLDLEQFNERLPDRDVHAIDLASGQTDLVVTDCGSLIFDLDVNPASGKLWALSSDSRNTFADSEPGLNGQFVINQLVTASVAGATGTVAADAGIDLDDIDFNTAGAQYERARSLNQARTFDFLEGSSGAAFVGGPLSDVIAFIKQNGKRLGDFQLPAGAQCYSIRVYNPQVFLALCLGDMKIHAFQWSPYVKTPIASLDLGFDPTPDQVRRGRDVFLDGQRSQDGRSSCAACHPDGMTDQLGWSLKGPPCDVKDLQVTQSLLSIADTFPHHWREERDLVDFQKAWGGLLGAPVERQPSEAEMADFVAYVYSLQAPPNPLQNVRRIVDDAKTPDPVDGIVGSAVDGQQFFQNSVNFNDNTCAECHILESGSNGNMLAEVFSQVPRVASTGIAHLRQLQHKGQEVVTVSPAGIDLLVNEDGFGTSHNGTLANLDRFVRDGFALPDVEEAGITNFVKQWDQGIAPGATWGAWFDSTSPLPVVHDIRQILVDGADQHWNGVFVAGSFNGVPTRWAYDVQAAVFVNEDPAVASLTWAQMRAATFAGQAAGAFLGTPPGSARRIGIDFDNDGLINGFELALGTDPWDRDSDGDGFQDGHEHDNGDDPTVPQATSSDTTAPALVSVTDEFASARTKKFGVTLSEPCTYVVDYGAGLLFDQRFERGFFTRCDTLVLTHDLPSTPGGPAVAFGARITLTDLAGNVGGPFDLPGFSSDATQDQLGLPTFLHVASLELVGVGRSATSMAVQVRIAAAQNHGAPAFLPAVGQMVFSTVAVDRGSGFQKSTDFTTSLPTSFDLDTAGNVYDREPGRPWLVSDLTNGNGETIVTFTQANLSAGDVVKLSVMGMLEPVAGQTSVFQAIGLAQFQLLSREDAAVLAIPF